MRYYGVIGYGTSAETVPGVWQDTIVEKQVFGDVEKNLQRNINPNKVNEDITINNTISVIADPYAMENYRNIKYATLEGVKWKVSSVEIDYPRLILVLGGLYNG